MFIYIGYWTLNIYYYYYSILLQTLRNRYGITHNALKWVQSYLTEIYQCVSISDHQSYRFKLTTGVPQGSVLGPLLFSLYVQPIGDIIRKHGLSFHHYADNLQLYDIAHPLWR